METRKGPESEPIVIKIEEFEESAREKEIRVIAEQAQFIALRKLTNASNLTDYLRWHRAASFYFTPSNIRWAWDYGGTTVEELMTEQESSVFITAQTKNAATIEALRSTIDSLPFKKGMIRIGIKRVRNQVGSYEYRVLALFPKESSVNDPLDKGQKIDVSKGEQIVFFEPQTACLNHACDDLYKIYRDSAFYVTDRTLQEAVRQLQSKKEGVVEYLLEKTETESVKQDPSNYLIVGLLGGYSNERLRVRVSDYFNNFETNFP